ncbi:MAG: DUF1800 family protein, partial [Gemmatimonadetes bacterium]|nr:DUF1800 family protein [Gemmatimonadota bacterium]
MHRTDRRTQTIVLTVLLLAGCSRAAAPSLTSTPASAPADAAFRELTADQQVAQALSRLTFGARPGEAQRVRAMGVDQWIDLQLHPERIADPSAESFFAAYEVYHSTPAELDERHPRPQTVLNQLGKAGNRANRSAADSARLREL